MKSSEHSRVSSHFFGQPDSRPKSRKSSITMARISCSCSRSTFRMVTAGSGFVTAGGNVPGIVPVEKEQDVLNRALQRFSRRRAASAVVSPSITVTFGRSLR